MKSIDKTARELIFRVKKWIRAESLILRGDRVLCALSGGADSVAMLLILDSLKTELGFELRAAHVNHMLRGAEAERDANFCKKLCERKSIGFSMLCGDAAGISRERKVGIEEGARLLRYELLKKERKSAGYTKIATAHNADDNLETVIINISRGAALKGIAGIMPKNKEIIRPLLVLTRQEINTIVSYFGEEYVIDSTNETDFCRRNRIRHDIIPILREFNPNVASVVLENSIILRNEDEYLQKSAQRELDGIYKNGCLDIDGLKRLDCAMRMRVLRLAAFRAEAALDGEKTNKLDELLETNKTTWRFDIGNGVVCQRSYSRLFLKKEEKKNSGDFCIKLSDGTQRELVGGFKVYVEKAQKSQEVNNLLNVFAINCDRIDGDLVIRCARSGDFFRKNAKSGSKKLSRLFIDMKIPRGRRAYLPLIADNRGVLWVYGIGANAEFPPYDRDSEGLIITVQRDESRKSL